MPTSFSYLVDNDLRRKALLSASRQTAKAIRQNEEAEEEEKEEEEARQVEKWNMSKCF